MFNVQINHLTVLKKLDQIKNGDCKDGERSGSGVEQVHVHLYIFLLARVMYTCAFFICQVHFQVYFLLVRFIFRCIFYWLGSFQGAFFIGQVHIHLCIFIGQVHVHLLCDIAECPFLRWLNFHLIVVELGHHESEFFLGVEAGKLLAHLQGDHQQLYFFKYFEYGQQIMKYPKAGS